MKRTAVIVMVIAMLAGAGFAQEKQLTVDEIINKANLVSYYQGKDGRAQVKMTITDANGQKRNREFTILRWDKPGADETFCEDQKFYVYFNRPADVNKMAFLVHKYLDKDDDRWLFLPALNLVKRISSADKRTSFVGSHFYYEDVSGRNIKADTHELVETTKDFYVVKSTPKDPGSVEFAYFKSWIHRKTFVVIQSSYYNSQDKELRQYKAESYKEIQGYPTITKSKMTDMRAKGHTVIDYSDVRYDTGVEESVFTERYLKRPPYKYLR
ncbi:outer membrane lipoprotein-sorting protein [Desulfococcaceae bacterium HSG8]|nr:outer membrane lipoprotein-sorting protein [Desulfococcaceae bacterium HSG8]